MAPEDKEGNNAAAEETPEKSKVDTPPKENTPPKEKRQLKRKVKEEKGSDSIMEEVLSISGNSEGSSKSKKNRPSENSGLPDGWKRTTVIRKSGKTAGQVDVYFFTPDGVKLRSKPEVKSYLTKKKLSIKLDAFDFSKRIENGEKEKVKKSAAAKKSKDKKTKTSDGASGEGTSQDEDDVEANGEESAEEETVKKSPQKKAKKSPAKPMKKEVVQIKALKKKRTKK